VPKEDKIHDADNYFFVFVNLRGSLDERPDYYMVTSKFLKDYVKKAFEAWMKTPPKRGKPHSKENPMRIFPIHKKRFENPSYQQTLVKPINLEEFKMDRILEELSS